MTFGEEAGKWYSPFVLLRRDALPCPAHAHTSNRAISATRSAQRIWRRHRTRLGTCESRLRIIAIQNHSDATRPMIISIVQARISITMSAIVGKASLEEAIRTFASVKSATCGQMPVPSLRAADHRWETAQAIFGLLVERSRFHASGEQPLRRHLFRQLDLGEARPGRQSAARALQMRCISSHPRALDVQLLLRAAHPSRARRGTAHSHRKRLP